MIRLLVVVNVFYPDRGGGAAVFSDMCYALAERGIDVTVHSVHILITPNGRTKAVAMDG